MIDWPGRVAATVFIAGCDFRCPYCHNPQLSSPVSGSDQWDALKGYLRMRRSWLDGVVITGGEPTDDPGLPDLLDAIRSEGIPVKLDTNGSHPELLGRLIDERLVDSVAVDIKATPERYAQATGRQDASDRVTQTIATLRDSGTEHEFRTTVYPGVVELDELPRIASILEGCDRYALQQFRSDRTLDPAAASVTPYHADDLESARALCSQHLPTVLRGVHA